jgi:hypothetical protein
MHIIIQKAMKQLTKIDQPYLHTPCAQTTAGSKRREQKHMHSIPFLHYERKTYQLLCRQQYFTISIGKFPLDKECKHQAETQHARVTISCALKCHVCMANEHATTI